jgi:hypothetical protein
VALTCSRMYDVWSPGTTYSRGPPRASVNSKVFRVELSRNRGFIALAALGSRSNLPAFKSFAFGLGLDDSPAEHHLVARRACLNDLWRQTRSLAAIRSAECSRATESRTVRLRLRHLRERAWRTEFRSNDRPAGDGAAACTPLRRSVPVQRIRRERTVDLVCLPAIPLHMTDWAKSRRPTTPARPRPRGRTREVGRIRIEPVAIFTPMRRPNRQAVA